MLDNAEYFPRDRLARARHSNSTVFDYQSSGLMSAVTVRPDDRSPDVILRIFTLSYATQITLATQAMAAPEKIQYCATGNRTEKQNELEYESADLIAR